MWKFTGNLKMPLKDIPIKTELQPKTDFRKSQKARQNALR